VGQPPGETPSQEAKLIPVKFTREKTDLTIAQVNVHGGTLTFEDDVAEATLERGKSYIVHWRIMGASGGKLVVVKTVDDVDEEIVSSTIPAGKDRFTDFTDFTV